ncbi:MAG: SURF1 family protein [Actinomycetota bacterium]
MPVDRVADWSFARRPFWIFSHVFALTVVTVFVFLGLWQLDRHYEVADRNEIVGERSAPPALGLDEALALGDDEVDYRMVAVRGVYTDPDYVRVANRSQAGAAGEHVVALFEVADGRTLLVNRGFVPIGTDESELRPAPGGTVELVGWLRLSVTKGWLGATDTGEGDVVPRLDVDAIARRIDPTVSVASSIVAPQWLLLADDDVQAANGGTVSGDGGALASFPDPAPLPPLDGGPHLSYMGQWFIFAVLGVAFYGALLRRTARGGSRATPRAPDPIEV